MALRQALPGDMLLVIHEFVARSPDELSLAKGDKIELIERDDDFGDGWFLGKHMQNGNTGLFPEVYTQPAPKAALLPSPSPSVGLPRPNVAVSSPSPYSPPLMPGSGTATPPIFNQGKTMLLPAPTLASPGFVSPAHSSNFAQTAHHKPPGNSTGFLRHSPNASTVIDETMNVIDEHITSMHKPSLGVLGGTDRRPSNDSGSQYSTHFGGQLSSINGGGDQHEEEVVLGKDEVMSWSPLKVAQYLEKAGVEKAHCDVFQEEEFSGEVILGLDQSAILLQELRLGSIGRRMKTWAKIRALQEEVKNATFEPKQVSDRSNIAPAVVSTRQNLGIIAPPKSPSPGLRDNMANKFQSPTQSEFRQPSPQMGYPNQSSAQHSRRPSAAEIRGLAHSRQSSTDVLPGTATRYSIYDQPAHGKQASLDRSWTMANNKNVSQDRTWPVGARQTSPVRKGSRPASTVHLPSASTDRQQLERPASMLIDVDRGYSPADSSNGEVESRRQRAMQRKSESADQNQPTPERKRSSTFFWRGSRPPSPEKRPESTINARVVSEVRLDTASPTVTRLAYDTETPRGDQVSGIETPVIESLPVENQAMLELRKGLRTISDAITGRDKPVVQIPVEKPPQIDPLLQDTSTLAGSSTPSVNSKSIDLEDANKSEFSTPALPPGTPAAARKKPKKATSAYIRGLEKKSPREQMVGCDFSGWMKKKSSNFMTMWKPRLFVLRGRRLSYYYSEDDKEEKGLIDISNHRVLPADNDFITGLHATITGVTSSNSSMGSASSYFNSRHPTSPSSGGPESPVSVNSSRAPGTAAGSPLKGDNQTFIFKLVPPRSGLSKAVNFTKPTVHYFAVSSLAEGRQWMAALMKATIDKDDTKQVVTTYQQKTISLEKARARRERPPGLKEVDEGDEDEGDEEEADDGTGDQMDTVAGAREDAINVSQVVEPIQRNNDVNPSTTSPITSEDRQEQQHSAYHQSSASQSMSFVSSLQEHSTINTQFSTPSMGTGHSPLRKWSFGSSRKGSLGKVDSQGQGLGIHGTVAAPGSAPRDAGTW